MALLKHINCIFTLENMSNAQVQISGGSSNLSNNATVVNPTGETLAPFQISKLN